MLSQINNDIINSTSNNTHKFTLRIGKLIMQPSQRTFT
ncbi:Hypothetical protein ABZS17G119_01534 [Kosakonia cowanii]